MSCESTNPDTGQQCRLSGNHPEHFAGHGFLGDEVAWPNADYVAPIRSGPKGKSTQRKVLSGITERVDANEVFVRHDAPATSRAAAAEALPRSGTQKRTVYDMLAQRGPQGATDDEMIAHLGIKHQSLTPARYALREGGLIGDSGQRRQTESGNLAVVWVVADLVPDTV